MKNNSKMSKFVAIVLLLTIVALIIVSSTYAKYTSFTSGTGTAYVATWNVTLNGTKLENATFDIFGTVYDSNLTDEEGDVTQANDKTTIAPGTAGQFSLSIANNSDVTATISLTLAKADGSVDVPLEFSTDKTNWVSDIADVLDEAQTVAAGKAYEPTIYWRWAYEDSSSTTKDTSDTELGEASYTSLTGDTATRTSYNVTVSVTATQVD